MYHGRAAGHNILPFLEYLDSRKDIETKFCYSKDKTFKETNSNLSFHKVEYRKTGQIQEHSKVECRCDLVSWGAQFTDVSFVFTF
jgi:hypothetical protein